VLPVLTRAGLDERLRAEQLGELVGGQRAGAAVAHADHVAARGRLRHQRLDRAGEADGAAVQERHGRGEAADLVDALGGPQHGGAVARGEPRDQRADPLGALGVEVVRGLVDEQDGRRGEQRAGDREALLHAVRPAADRAARRLGEADVLQHLAGARDGGALAHAVQAREEDEVLETGDAQVERAVAGRDETDAAASGAAAAVGAEDADAAAARVDEPAQHAQQRGLAGAVGAEQGVDLAGPCCQVDALQGLALAEAAHEAADLDGAGRLTGHVAIVGTSGAHAPVRSSRWEGSGGLRPGRSARYRARSDGSRGPHPRRGGDPADPERHRR
jgi:hypothetical protein